LGGFDTTSEMCQAFVWYYPRGELRFCESAYDEYKMMQRFGVEGIAWDNLMEPPVITAPEALAGQYFDQAVDNMTDWTPALIDDLQHEVRYTTHYEVSCGSSPMPEQLRKKHRMHSRLWRQTEPEPILISYPELDEVYVPPSNCPTEQ